MRVAVTGATGFVGGAVVDALLRRGDVVIALTRDPSRAFLPAAAEAVKFDVNDAVPNPGPLEGLDAVIHLAGETVDGRWTAAKKRGIFDSRVVGTRNLIASLAACKQRPKILISASAVGFYGDRGDEPLDDASGPGADFLASVCKEWERGSAAAAALGMRVAWIRVSMVLGAAGGALGKLLPIFKLGAGGPLGSGKQWMPWIHLSDLADMFCFALDHDVSGPMAGVAPDYAQNRRVMQAIGNALGRPSLAPAPGFALKLVVGEFADTLLGGQLIIPTTALDAGFKWKHPSLEQALIDLLSPARPRATGIQTFESEQVVPGSVEAVFAFFSEAGNLARITPPGMGFRIDAEKATASRRGAVIDYALRVHGIGMRWRSMIAQWDPGVGFVDVQLRGPYQLWRHTHAFEKREGGVAVRDLVEWSLPFAPLSAVAQALVRRDLENVFAFRRRKVEEIFAG